MSRSSNCTLTHWPRLPAVVRLLPAAAAGSEPTSNALCAKITPSRSLLAILNAVSFALHAFHNASVGAAAARIRSRSSGVKTRSMNRRSRSLPATPGSARSTMSLPIQDRVLKVLLLHLAQLPDDLRREVAVAPLSLIHISEPTRLGMISYAVFCLTK